MNISFIFRNALFAVLAISFLPFFASSAAASPTYYYVDARPLAGTSWAITLRSVQAIANKNSPRLFIVGRDEDINIWLPALQNRLGTTFQVLTPIEAFNKFVSNSNQAIPEVIYDPARCWTLDLATTRAGIGQCVLADHDLANDPALNFHWGKAYDYTDPAHQGTDRIAEYNNAISELMPLCHSDYLVYLDDNYLNDFSSPPKDGAIASLRDYAIQQKAFVFDLDFDSNYNSSDSTVFDKIIATNETLRSQRGHSPESVIFGWFPVFPRIVNGIMKPEDVEASMVRHVSQDGGTINGANLADNLSFFDRLPPPPTPLQQTRVARNLAFQPRTKYVLLVASDGDSIQLDLGKMADNWTQNRPYIPLAWTISPQLMQSAPWVLQEYYQAAAARGGWDEFVAGFSGLNYVYPSDLPTTPIDHLGNFVQSTKTICGNADIHSIAILDDKNSWTLSALIPYANAGFDALWLIDYPGGVPASIYGSQPKPTAYLSDTWPRLEGALSLPGTLKAIAYENGMIDSSVQSQTFTSPNDVTATPPPPANGVVATPQFTIKGGSSSAIAIQITCGTSGAAIRYTVDGTPPSETNGTVYVPDLIDNSQAVMDGIVASGSPTFWVVYVDAWSFNGQELWDLSSALKDASSNPNLNTTYMLVTPTEMANLIRQSQPAH